MNRTIAHQVVRIITALLVAVPSTIALATTTAGVATCLPTTFNRDNHLLTAAQIGGTVSGTLDASGCDIGVYFASPGSVTAGAQISSVSAHLLTKDSAVQQVRSTTRGRTPARHEA